MIITIRGILTFLLIFFSTSLLFSLPKFASRTGASCQSCHINPSGKGMRTEFGRTYGRDELTMALLKEQTDFDDLPSKITEYFSIGGDFRTLYYYDQATRTSSFFQMQGNLYFDFRLNKSVRVYFSKGLYDGSFELFGLAKALPLDGHVKIGRFLPAYGTRIDDHNAFIRGGPYGNPALSGLIPSGYPKGLPFGERAEDTGIELGIAPGPFTLTAGIFNGTPGVLQPTAGTKHKTAVLRTEGRFRVAEIKMSLGGSVYVTPNSNANTYYGVFGAITPLEGLTVTSEVDYIESKPSAGSSATGMVFWSELNWMVIQGIELKVGYDFYDPDRDLRMGTVSQLSLGAEFFLMSGVEFRPTYKIGLENLTPSRSVENDQFLMIFHFFF
jgi:hypothetical protein